jgi:hypothetical protein
LFQTFAPSTFLHRPDDQIIVPNRLRVIVVKQIVQQMFDFILVSDKQVAVLAVPTSVVEGNHARRVDVNEQGHFALAGLAVAKGTARKTQVWIGIEDEVVFRRHTPEASFLSCGHAIYLCLAQYYSRTLLRNNPVKSHKFYPPNSELTSGHWGSGKKQPRYTPSG